MGTKVTFAALAVVAAFALLIRSADADPIGVVVDRNADGLIVTVNTAAANIHFSYDASCANQQPCFTINASQGPVGIPASASSCVVKQGSAFTPTAIQCPAGVGSVQFKLVDGATWSAYAGGGGLHTGTTCSPARVIVTTGKGANSVNSWDGCREVIFCNSAAGGFSAVEADASDDIHGTCSSVIKH